MPNSEVHRDAAVWVWLQGAGIGVLVMLRLLWVHISPLHEDLFHRNLPMTSVYRGVLIDFLVACAVGIALMRFMDRRDPQSRSWLWIPIAAALMARAAGWAQETWIEAAWVTPRRVFLCCVVIGLALWIVRRAWYAAAVRCWRVLLLGVGCCTGWILPQMAWMALHPEPVQARSFTRPMSGVAARRIIWILFDELSHDQTFDRRYPGLALSSFDRFAAESVSFSDVQPDGYMTEMIIPGLLDGNVILDEKTDLDGRLYVKTQHDPHWHAYPAQNTLFAAAQRAGWSTAAAGWFLPWCRLYENELDACFRTMRFPLPGGYSRRRSAEWNALAPIRKPLLRIAGQPLRTTSPAELHARDFREILAHGESMIADERIGFVFLHLPVPHPTGFYDRATDTLGRPGSYIDNLALADRTLAQILDTIAQTGAADRTTVVISSDHSWRIPMWRPEAGWTQEDEAALGNHGFDQRPVLMVRFPGERDGAQVNAAFPIIREHDLVRAVLAQQITTAAQLQQWAAQ